ncbi:MAG: DNA mismatch repair endonuclease MutH [Myxococcales bacterium]|nr:DNA mismatch repair endonuclease MutH [Deltaproteobacteria bacterium]NNE19098.1 DNA mismatch repair endonuclease MutH [Myxococcales bacterium]
MLPVPEPLSDQELLARARDIAGLTLGELGARVGVEVPSESMRGKGVAGQILEKALGATAGSRSEPDFVDLGIELKTIPLDARGKPKESTFVCSISLATMADTDWEGSTVLKKLSNVLFVPVEAASETPLRNRRVGRSYLWAPDQEEETLLRTDWERLADTIARGDVERITGHLGQVLQVRPKAPHGRSRRRAPDEEGAVQWTMPRGFYLRPAFTGAVLARLRAVD